MKNADFLYKHFKLPIPFVPCGNPTKFKRKVFLGVCGDIPNWFDIV